MLNSFFGRGMLYQVFSLLSINSYVLSNRHNVIKNTDVESVKINLNNFDYYYNFSSFLSDVEIKDKDLIDSLLLRSIDSYSCNKYNDYNISYDLKLKNSKTASIGTCIDEDYEKEFMTKIKSNIQVLSKFNNISYKNLYAPSINGMLLDDEVINIIKKSMANKSINSNNIKYLEHERAIYLHSYVNHEYKLYNFNYEMSDELKEIITKQENNLLKEIIDNLDIYHFYIHSDIFSKYENIYNLVYDDIEKFIKNDIKNEIDINKEYVTITLHNDSKTYKYNTNNINGLINLLESKYNEIKNIEEYSYLFDGENLYD